LAIANALLPYVRRGLIKVTVIERNRFTEYRPGYIFVGLNMRSPDDIRAPVALLKRRGVEVVNAEATAIDAGNRVVKTAAGDVKYDLLVVATGAETVDVTDPGKGVFHVWELDAAVKFRDALARFSGGTLLVGAIALPYRCPPAPWEMALALHFHLLARGIRDRTRLVMVHQWKRPFEGFGPNMARMMEEMMGELGIEYIGVGQAPAITEIGNHEVVLANGERVRFDLAMIVPRHVAPRVVAESELANPQNRFAQPRNGKYGDFRSVKYDDVYVVGDVAHPNVPVGMAGVVFHSYLDFVVARMLQDLLGVSPPQPEFKLVGTCSFDVGGFGLFGVCDFTRFVRGEAPYPACTMIPSNKVFRLAKRLFEDMYFSWLLGVNPKEYSSAEDMLKLVG